MKYKDKTQAFTRKGRKQLPNTVVELSNHLHFSEHPQKIKKNVSIHKMNHNVKYEIILSTTEN